MSDFKPLSPDRVEMLKQVLGQVGDDSGDGDRAVVVDRQTGNVVGAAADPDQLSPDRVNAIARFDRHYGRGG